MGECPARRTLEVGQAGARGAGQGTQVGDGLDPRPAFSERLRALRDAAGVSVRDLGVVSATTPRRRASQPPLRLKRSTIAGMTSRTRPARPEQDHFEVFVDICIRVAEESGRQLPGDLGDRQAWDEAYSELLTRMTALRANNRVSTEAAQTAASDDRKTGRR